MSLSQKILIGCVLSLVCMGAYLLLSNTSSVTNYPSSGTGIIAIGDSLVQGVGSQNGTGFIGPLSSLIREPIRNYGKSGDTTGEVLARLPEVLAENPTPKVVIVLAGGNDFLRKVPPEQTFSNLKEIIRRSHQSGAVVLVLGIRGGALSDTFDERFETLIKEEGTAYVSDVLSGLFARSEYMADAIHPNDAGYAKIAERIYPMLSGLLK